MSDQAHRETQVRSWFGFDSCQQWLRRRFDESAAQGDDGRFGGPRVAVIHAEPGIGIGDGGPSCTRQIRGLFEQLSADPEWNPPNERYWPRAFTSEVLETSEDRVLLRRVGPDRSAFPAACEPRFLWLGASAHPPLFKWRKGEVRPDGILRLLADECGLHRALRIDAGHAGPRELDALLLDGLAAYFGNQGAVPMVLWIDSCQWLTADEWRFIGDLRKRATADRWPLLMILTRRGGCEGAGMSPGPGRYPSGFEHLEEADNGREFRDLRTIGLMDGDRASERVEIWAFGSDLRDWLRMYRPRLGGHNFEIGNDAMDAESVDINLKCESLVHRLWQIGLWRDALEMHSQIGEPVRNVTWYADQGRMQWVVGNRSEAARCFEQCARVEGKTLPSLRWHYGLLRDGDDWRTGYEDDQQRLAAECGDHELCLRLATEAWMHFASSVMFGLIKGKGAAKKPPAAKEGANSIEHIDDCLGGDAVELIELLAVKVRCEARLGRLNELHGSVGMGKALLEWVSSALERAVKPTRPVSDWLMLTLACAVLAEALAEAKLTFDTWVSAELIREPLVDAKQRSRTHERLTEVVADATRLRRQAAALRVRAEELADLLVVLQWGHPIEGSTHRRSDPKLVHDASPDRRRPDA